MMNYYMVMQGYNLLSGQSLPGCYYLLAQQPPKVLSLPAVTEHYYSSGWTETTQRLKDIYLPISPRNTILKVWCALHDDTDRSFTYTVVDWDGPVTVNVPDFD